MEKIIEVAELEEKDFILEIGPGKGALTSKLIDSKISRLHAVELDKDLIDHLNHKFKNDKRFSLQQGDILSTNLDSINIFRVPGAFEIPIACKTAAETGKYEAILGLGCVIKGDTPHFDYVCTETARGIGAVSLESNVPTSFGLLTVDNVDQALERSADNSQNKGREAAQTAIEMISVLGEMRAINNEKC